MQTPRDEDTQTPPEVNWTIRDVDPEFAELLDPKAGVPPGVFWADYIKTLKDDPERRLAVARAYLPLPAAFRHAAVALRALIRRRRKDRQQHEDLFAEFYRVAAEYDLRYRTPYIEEIGPGFNVSRYIPQEVIDATRFPYDQIGYEKLELLTKTDRKWLVEAWGEPSRQSSAQEFHSALWEDAIRKAAAAKRQAQERSRQERQELIQDSSGRRGKVASPVLRRSASQSRGCLGVLATVAISPILIIALILTLSGSVTGDSSRPAIPSNGPLRSIQGSPSAPEPRNGFEPLSRRAWAQKSPEIDGDRHLSISETDTP